MAEKTYLTSPTIRENWHEWMRPWILCLGCDSAWPDYDGIIRCICVEEEE